MRPARAADWIEEQQVGIVLNSFSRIAEAVAGLLRPEVYSRYRNNAAAIRNFAVFEIPALLDQILAGASSETQQIQPLRAKKQIFIEMSLRKRYDPVTVLAASSL